MHPNLQECRFRGVTPSLMVLPSVTGSRKTAEVSGEAACNTGFVVQLLFPSQLLSPLVSTSLSLSLTYTHTDTHWLSERSSLLPLSLSLTSAFSLFLPPLPPSPLLFFNREITRQREQPGCSPPVRTLITCGSWHSNRISYALLPLPSLSQAHQLTHRHAPQRQMGIPGLERLCLPHQERADQKLQPVFYEVRVIKLLADLVYLKTTGPCGPSSSRGVPPPWHRG